MQIGAAARYTAKCVMPAEEKPGRVLRGPACDYLPCGRRTCGVFLGRGTEMLFLFDLMRSLIAVRNALKRSKTAEGSPGCAPRGTACDYLPCGREDSPSYFRLGDRDAAFYFFIRRHVNPLGILGCTKLQRWTRAHLGGLAECFTRADT